MDLKTTLCSVFAMVTFLIVSGISIFNYDRMDMHAIFSLMWKTVPATIVMGILGRLMGAILDKPHNLADSDYQTDVLQALKKMDKSMTLADLNKKLTPEAPQQEIQIQAPPLDETEEEGNNEPSE